MTTANPIVSDFRQQRAAHIARYFRAIYPCDRKNARGWVLHYGRLIRKLEGRA